jgi:hypothetical protein
MVLSPEEVAVDAGVFMIRRLRADKDELYGVSDAKNV